jgi:guanylate kinase
MLQEQFPSYFGFSVSHTTRNPREGEVDGVQYNFVTPEDMTKEIEQGKFMEYACVHTNYYGTSFAAIEKIQAEGRICILDIDIQGVESVKRSGLPSTYVFISPPSIEELEKRLRGRNSESNDKINIRLDNARGEMEYGMVEGNFNAVVVNDNLDNSFNDILTLLSEYYPDFAFFTTEQGEGGNGEEGGEYEGEYEGEDEDEY